jgi:hypothetical protein
LNVLKAEGGGLRPNPRLREMGEALLRGLPEHEPLDSDFHVRGAPMASSSCHASGLAPPSGQAHDAPKAQARIEHADTLAAMWAASLAPGYLGNPSSACDAIVAHWRAPALGGMHPASCFEGYATQPEDSGWIVSEDKEEYVCGAT